ncbi:MAG: phage tail tip lysozyme [Gallintestinimicrobium sp.]
MTRTQRQWTAERLQEPFSYIPWEITRQYGYGFCQWTSAGRKAGLYDLVKSRGVSIGDAKTQTEYMLTELQTSYKNVWKTLQTATSVQEASDIFLTKFEAPANTGSAVKKTRASYGEQYLKIYKDIEKEETNMSLISNSGHDENGKYSGGKAGDQTGTEWALIPWYNRPWKCVLRHPDAKVRAKLAELGIKAAKNDLVGYDQDREAHTGSI